MSENTTRPVDAINWRDIVGFEGKYQVSDHGDVRSLTARGRPRKNGPRPKKLAPDKNGYLLVRLCTGRAATADTRRVHHLVLEAFVGPCPPGMEGAHNNGRHDDNRAANLRWDTHRENCGDKVRHGTLARGTRHGNAKLTDEQVIEIRASAEGAAVLAKRHGVSASTVNRVKNLEAWRHV